MLKIGDTLNYKLYKSLYIEDHIPPDLAISFVENNNFHPAIKEELYKLFKYKTYNKIPNYCITHVHKQIFNTNKDIIGFSLLRCNILCTSQTMDPEAGTLILEIYFIEQRK